MQKQLIIDTNQKVTPLGDLYGLFFEDLNHAADGGLYAELVQNRSFEFDPIDNKEYHGLTAWEKVEKGGARVTLAIEDKTPINSRNPHYLAVTVEALGKGAGVMNLGFNSGIPVEKEKTYHFSCYIKSETVAVKPIIVKLLGAEGQILAEGSLQPEADGWKKYELSFTAVDTDYSGRLVLEAQETGRFYFDMVSLFPADVFKGRKNGLRPDIAQLLADCKPKFLRFPGGCLVHDGSLNSEDRDSLYRWKNTLGPVEERPARRNNWGYNQTLGLGYFEYFQFCEDIGAKPLPVLPGAYDPHHQRMVPLDELDPWIQEALDLIEFANGDKDTEWGKIRSELGHEEPFHLEYLGIGNEEVGEPFFERYTYFHKAIREKYPDIKIINSSGPFAAGREYDRGWESAKENGSDLVDEHYYQSPEWFLANYHRYDSFKAEDPKVFLGEYASWGNTYYNALVEAAFMTGLEKNAHAVGLACYAPLLCNTDYVNWRPDMIWFNNHEVFGTANYYVQKLFMEHQGEYLLKTSEENFAKIDTTESKPISGKLLIAAAVDTKVSCSDIIFEDITTGEVKRFEGAVLKEREELELLETNSSHYRLSFTGKKKSGARGFEISFGFQNNENRAIWELGGWQNMDCIVSSTVNGRGSCLTQSFFVVEDNREYQLVLEVEGRKIRTYIDGILMNETEDKLPLIEDLYYTASVEDNGDYIVKLVNVKDTPTTFTLTLKGQENTNFTGSRYVLAGYSLEDMNSFEEPQKIVPLKEDLVLSKGTGEITLLGHSIVVLRLTKN